jgi:hypothetical protein
MDVVSTCPLRVAAMPWQPREGAWSLAVVCKATFTLTPGESPLADEQDEPNEADTYWNDDESRSLHSATDLVPFKKRAEVLVIGHAYAPEGRPVTSLRARVVVGDVDKVVEVVCDRVWTIDGQLVEGSRFAKMPLHWERAAGGTANPVGVRADARPDARGRLVLPNLQPPGTFPARPGDFIEPIGFAPIAPTWPERWQRRQRVRPDWDHRRWEATPLPPELDPSFFNAAPRDQQLDVIRPTERILLENLHPDHPRLVTNLAGVAPVAELARAEGSPERFSLRCDTMVIDTDRGRCTLTWRAQIPIDDPARAGRVTISLSAKRTGALSGATLAADARAPAAPLPFGKSDPGLVKVEPPRIVAAPEPAPAVMPDRTVELEGTGAIPVLPFRVGRSPLAGTVLGGAAPPAPRVEDLDEETTTDGFAPQTADIPPPAAMTMPVFGGAAPSADALPAGWAARAAPAPPPSAPAFVPPAPTPPPPAPAFVAPMPTPPPPAPAFVAPVPAPYVAPAPLPSHGTPFPLPITAAPVAEVPIAAAPLTPSLGLLAEAPPAPKPSGPPIERFPIARCAAVAASMARRRDDAQAILDENEIVAADFRAVERHWAKEMEAEAARGRRALLDAYDDAYVGRLEEERGPIEPMEYARIVVASERGSALAALAALSLPRDAIMRIERVFLRRTLADAKLARQVRRAIAAAREE